MAGLMKNFKISGTENLNFFLEFLGFLASQSPQLEFSPNKPIEKKIVTKSRKSNKTTQPAHSSTDNRKTHQKTHSKNLENSINLNRKKQ
jgi:hypothetical protein